MNLFIDIQPSKALRRVFLTLWGLLLTSVFLFMIIQFSLLASLILLLLVMLVAVPFVLWQRKLFKNSNRGVKQLQFIDGAWYLVIQHGAETDKKSIELANDNVLWPWWIKLSYRQEKDEESKSLVTMFSGHEKQLLICRDSVSETDFRHLSRVLRFYRKEITEVD